jgi:hypothetical protein
VSKRAIADRPFGVDLKHAAHWLAMLALTQSIAQRHGTWCTPRAASRETCGCGLFWRGFNDQRLGLGAAQRDKEYRRGYAYATSTSEGGSR